MRFDMQDADDGMIVWVIETKKSELISVVSSDCCTISNAISVVPRK
jgi:hypothetical protein